MLTTTIISLLLSWIEINTDYSTKNFKTKIVEVSKKEIQKIACGGKCPIIAFYKPEEAIYISKMNFEKNYCNQSILLHEMIHVLQSKKIENVFKEKEAYLHVLHRRSLCMDVHASQRESLYWTCLGGMHAPSDAKYGRIQRSRVLLRLNMAHLDNDVLLGSLVHCVGDQQASWRRETHSWKGEEEKSNSGERRNSHLILGLPLLLHLTALFA